MKILFIGDIFGEVGREAVYTYLPLIKKKYQVECVIANAENATHGRGISSNHYHDLLNHGVNLITMGNHTFDRQDMFDWINQADFLIRPANYTNLVPGIGTKVIEINQVKIRVTNLIGRVFMDGAINNPYEVFDEIIKADQADIHIVDFHAEASSEKIAFALNYDGIISALIGTHTHVTTADEQILPKGSGFISDVGMCGSYQSCIGMDPKNVIYKMKTGLPARFEVAKTKPMFSGLLLDFNNKNQLVALKRINLNPSNQYELD
ncbi:MAG: TIGR00282 family metallophosphoesterase [Bacilli bacterium]